MVDPAPKQLTKLPPSAKLVYKTLEWEGPLTQKAITEHTRLPARTVRAALTRLDEHDLVQRDMYLPDTRQNEYRLTLDTK